MLKRRSVTVAITFLVFSALAPPPFDHGAAKASEPSKLAIIVSIGQYMAESSLRPLPSAKRDAGLMREVFQNLGYSILEVPDGSWNEVREAIRSDKRVGSASFIAFYFSGHGIFCCATEGEDTSTSWDDAPLLLFAGFERKDFGGRFAVGSGELDPDAPVTEAGMNAATASEAVTVATIKRFLRRQSKAPLLFLVDACRNVVTVERVGAGVFGTLHESARELKQRWFNDVALDWTALYGTITGEEAAALTIASKASAFTVALRSAIGTFGESWPLVSAYVLHAPLEHSQRPRLAHENVVSPLWMSASESSRSRLLPIGSVMFVSSPDAAAGRGAVRWSVTPVPEFAYSGDIYYLKASQGLFLSYHKISLDFVEKFWGFEASIDSTLGTSWKEDRSYVLEVEYPFDNRSCWWAYQTGGATAIRNHLLEEVFGYDDQREAYPEERVVLKFVSARSPTVDCNPKQRFEHTVRIRLLRRTG